MLQDQEGLLKSSTPLKFADGTKTYEKFAEEYIQHKKGYFILGPSGIGKSYFVRHQKVNEKHWIDADQIWRKARAMPIGAWWENLPAIEAIEQQCDIITVQAKKIGFWMLGASCDWLKPDAIVLPHWQTHVRYIKKRELNYDGGATTENLDQVLRHRAQIRKWAQTGVPKFKSIDSAIDYLEKIYKNEMKNV